MAHYVSLHSLACLTRQGADQLVARLSAATDIATRRIQVNMQEGKMLVEFEAPNRETLEKWLHDEGFHYDWLLRIELEARSGRLEPA